MRTRFAVDAFQPADRQAGIIEDPCIDGSASIIDALHGIQQLTNCIRPPPTHSPPSPFFFFAVVFFFGDWQAAVMEPSHGRTDDGI